MGLDITAMTYDGSPTWSEKFGSYGTIHRLRNWVFTELLDKKKIIGSAVNEDETYYDGKYGDYPALLDHSDADGYYLSFSEFKITEVSDRQWCGNLDKLREELTALKEHYDRMPEDVQYVYNRLCEVVNSKDEYGENECVIVVFR